MLLENLQFKVKSTTIKSGFQAKENCILIQGKNIE